VQSITPEELRVINLIERWRRDFPTLSHELRILRLNYELAIERDRHDAAVHALEHREASQ
jgi:hypothetical protein